MERRCLLCLFCEGCKQNVKRGMESGGFSLTDLTDSQHPFVFAVLILTETL